jgi:CAAX protease family protein
MASTAGVLTAVSVWRMTRPVAVPTVMSTGGLLGLVLTECVMGAVWIPVLTRRGWTLARVSLPPSARDLVRAAGLFVGCLFAYWVGWYFTATFAPQFARLATGISVAGQPSWMAVALVSIVNPVAEEFFYLGFVATVLRRESTSYALVASVVVRLAVHLYQGPLAIISIVPAGLVLGSYYLRTNRIWPVIVAHMAMDALSLGRLASAA